MKLNNSAVRIIVAILGIPVIVGFCMWGGLAFLFFVGIIALVSFYEFYLMLKSKNADINLTVGMISVLLILLNAYYNFISTAYLFAIIMIVLLLHELFRNKGSGINNIGGTVLALFYVGYFSSFLIDIREFYTDLPMLYERGGYLIITVMSTIWICDSAAYFFGSAFGKHKLFPRVSPNKSWEGAIAGFIFPILTVVAAKYITIEFMEWDQAIGIGLIVGIFGQLGDLVESLMKRDANVKDSSSIIPGHGGIFDRFDSLIFSAPIIYLFLFYTS